METMVRMRNHRILQRKADKDKVKNKKVVVMRSEYEESNKKRGKPEKG